MPFFLYKLIFKTLLSMGCILTSAIMATMNLLRNDVRSANSNNPSSALTAWAETKAIVRRPTPLTPHLELSNSLPKNHLPQTNWNLCFSGLKWYARWVPVLEIMR